MANMMWHKRLQQVQRTQTPVVRMDWGVPQSWARGYPLWEKKVEEWVNKVRSMGLSQIIIREERFGVDLIALPPGEKWEDAA